MVTMGDVGEGGVMDTKQAESDKTMPETISNAKMRAYLIQRGWTASPAGGWSHTNTALRLMLPSNDAALPWDRWMVLAQYEERARMGLEAR